MNKLKNADKILRGCNKYSYKNSLAARTTTARTRLFYLPRKCFSESKLPKALDSTAVVKKTRSLVPRSVERPEYYITGLVEKTAEPHFASKSALADHMDRMQDACSAAGLLRFQAGEFLKKRAREEAKHGIGVCTEDINTALHEHCLPLGAYPAALDYRRFPKSVSTSVNEVACHGIPDLRRLRNGDIVKVDTPVYLSGRYGDCCGTFIYGKGSQKSKDLVAVALECLEKAIKICGPGVPFNEIGDIIEKTAKKHKMGIVKSFAGHGIGTNLHSPPTVLSHSQNEYNPGVMKIGDTFTIEPIITTGDGEVYTHKDNWSVVTKDGEPCAQFEDTITIVKKGCTNLTKSFEAIDWTF